MVPPYGGNLVNRANVRDNLDNLDNAGDDLDNLDNEFSSTEGVTKGISRAYPLSSAIRTKAMGWRKTLLSYEWRTKVGGLTC